MMIFPDLLSSFNTQNGRIGYWIKQHKRISLFYRLSLGLIYGFFLAIILIGFLIRIILSIEIDLFDIGPVIFSTLLMIFCIHQANILKNQLKRANKIILELNKEIIYKE